jgi:uncharacterized membrane protein YoaK (UPF0700 family)
MWGGGVSSMAASAHKLSAALPFTLSVIAGSTDTVGFLSLKGLFTAHITGNIVVLAAHLLAGNPAVLSFLLAVPIFMLSLLLSDLLASRLKQRNVDPRRTLLSLQLLLLVGLFVLGNARPGFASKSALIDCAGMLGVAAMAVQVALTQISFPSTPSTVVMTTNVAQAMLALSALMTGADSAAVTNARSRLSYLLPVIVGFVIGCAAGAGAHAAFGLRSLALPAGLALIALAMTL